MSTTAKSQLLTSCLQELVNCYAELEKQGVDNTPKRAQIVPIVWTPPIYWPCPCDEVVEDDDQSCNCECKPANRKTNGKKVAKKGCGCDYSSMVDLCSLPSYQNRCAFACCEEPCCPTKCNPFCPSSCTPLSCYPMCCPPNPCATAALCGGCCCGDDDKESTVSNDTAKPSKRSKEKCVCDQSIFVLCQDRYSSHCKISCKMSKKTDELMQQLMGYMSDYVKECKEELKGTKTAAQPPPAVPVVYFNKEGKPMSCYSYQISKPQKEVPQVAAKYSMGKNQPGKKITFKFT